MREQTALIIARHCVRRLRGGAQAQLIEGNDGHSYAVKFLQNPQGRRVLINEFVCSILLRRLGIAAPQPALVLVDECFLKANPQCCPVVGDRRIPVQPGLHFGSRYPGSPSTLAIHDYLPNSVLPKVYNREDFHGALVFDKWVSNADCRQAIFYRARIEREMQDSPHWVAQMIDNGGAFQGCDWTFRDAIAQAVYPQRTVYGVTPSFRDFLPWLHALDALEPEVADEILEAMPAEWIDRDKADLSHLLKRLFGRRSVVPSLIAESVLFMKARAGRAQEIPSYLDPQRRPFLLPSSQAGGLTRAGDAPFSTQFA